jgi:hypothetical protein
LDSRLFGRVKKGELKKELAGIGRDKDAFPDADGDKKAKKPQGGRVVELQMGEGPAEAADMQSAMDESEAAKAVVAQEQQANRVLNPMTKQPIVLPSDEASRMALCFPRADANVAASDRLPWSPTLAFEAVASALTVASLGGNETMRNAVLANHDYLGVQAGLLLTGLKMNAQFRGAAEETAALIKARHLFLLAEATVNAPFRQLMRESEQRLGKVVNNYPALEKMVAKLPPSELASCWVLIKAAVSTWENKFVFDQVAVSKLEQASSAVSGTGAGSASDVSSKLEMLKAKVTNTQNNMALWQNMAAAFMAVPEAQKGLLPELLFLEAALALPTETDVRFLAAKNPEKQLEEGELRFRVRRLAQMVSRLNSGNYGALANKLIGINDALGRGTPDECDYYGAARDSPKLDFQTYEMPSSPLSSLRDWESRMAEAAMTPGSGGKGSGESGKAKLAARPKGLNWYHDKDDEAPLKSPDFLRTSLTVEDPEAWDSTISVREDQAVATAALAADQALAKSRGAKAVADAEAEDAETFGCGYSEADLERLVSEAEDHFAEDEEFLAALLLNAAGHKGHANELEEGRVDEATWASARAATQAQLGRDYNSPKQK